MPAELRQSIRATASLFVAGVLLVILAGCDSKPVATPSPSVPAATASLPTASVAASATSNLGLANVHTDDAHAATAAISADGGTVSATGADTTTYTLTIPAGALPGTTTISLYPVTGLTGLPTGAALGAAVQFLPDGLQLLAPATLTIQLASGIPQPSTGLAWKGDGAGIHARPAFVEGRTVTMQVLHFSGDGVGDIPLGPLHQCTSDDEMDEAIAGAVGSGDTAVGFKDILQSCYSDFVAPTLAADTQVATAGGDSNAWADGFVAYSSWLASLDLARTTLADPAFTVSPALAQSRTAGAAFLRAWYRYWNAECVGSKDQEWHVPVKFARLALLWTRQPAVTWNLATSANQLDLQTLLDQLCVKVVIDPSRSYSATGPGETGSVHVNAGFSIADDPPETAAGAVDVRVSLAGSNTFVGEGPTDATGAFAVDLAWPDGADPIKLDVLATLLDTEAFEAGPIESIDVPTNIERFDRITKAAQKLSFTFDSDLDGWSRGSVGPKGSANWGTEYWLHRHGGSVQLDGAGNPNAPNAWIFHTFSLPANTTTLSFDVSAHDRIGADTRFIVRVIEAGNGTTLVNEILHHTGPDGDLSFVTQSVDISRWAGKTVTIYFEQNDNGINGEFPGGDEQVHLDNIRIATG